MDCPVCKYPNPPGVTHCGMCHEVFNRSAAQAYLHAVKRERIEREGLPEPEEAIIKTQHVLEEVKARVTVIDWRAGWDQTLSLIKRFRPAMVITAGLVGLWLVLSFLFSASLWYTLLGKKMTFAFPDKNPPQFLVGMKTSVRTWSERHGTLDTPMEHFKIDELGNLVMEKKKITAKKNPKTLVTVRAKEWVQISNDAGAPISRGILKKHPSLAEARVVLDKKGYVLERRFALSPRLAKSVPFLAPRFPTGRLRRGAQWTDTVEWLDVYNDWQIEWKAVLHWTLGDLAPCREGTCTQLTYTAELEPRLRGAPDWARGGVHRLDATGTSGEGKALFDTTHKRLVANTFSYDGILHIPIDSLARIPWELRIGHRVKGPGEIVTRFENQIDIRKN